MVLLIGVQAATALHFRMYMVESNTGKGLKGIYYKYQYGYTVECLFSTIS